MAIFENILVFLNSALNKILTYLNMFFVLGKSLGMSSPVPACLLLCLKCAFWSYLPIAVGTHCFQLISSFKLNLWKTPFYKQLTCQIRTVTVIRSLRTDGNTKCEQPFTFHVCVLSSKYSLSVTWRSLCVIACLRLKLNDHCANHNSEIASEAWMRLCVNSEMRHFMALGFGSKCVTS